VLSGKDQLLMKYAKYVDRRSPHRRENSRMDSYLIEAVLEKPEYHPRQYLERLETITGRKPLFYNVLLNLRINRLDNPTKRSAWVEETKKTAKYLYYYLHPETGNHDKRKLYERLSERILKVPYIKKPMMDSKAVLIAMSRIGPLREDLSERLPNIMKYLDFGTLEYFLKAFIDEVAFEYGLRKKKSIEESLDDLASFIAVPEKREYETNDLQEQNDYLRQENEDLRSGLEITTQEVEEFRNNISLFREEEKKLAVSNFFQSLNCSQYGYLLDQMAYSEKQLQMLKEKGYQFPEEVESIPLTIRMFMRFLKEYGIFPIETGDSEREISLDACQNCDYSGSPFLTEDEKKNVRIVSSGWKIGDILISKPRVEETSSARDSLE